MRVSEHADVASKVEKNMNTDQWMLCFRNIRVTANDLPISTMFPFHDNIKISVDAIHGCGGSWGIVSQRCKTKKIVLPTRWDLWARYSPVIKHSSNQLFHNFPRTRSKHLLRRYLGLVFGGLQTPKTLGPKKSTKIHGLYHRYDPGLPSPPPPPPMVPPLWPGMVVWFFWSPPPVACGGGMVLLVPPLWPVVVVWWYVGMLVCWYVCR